jgi:hypothetical protein
LMLFLIPWCCDFTVPEGHGYPLYIIF